MSTVHPIIDDDCEITTIDQIQNPVISYVAKLISESLVTVNAKINLYCGKEEVLFITGGYNNYKKINEYSIEFIVKGDGFELQQDSNRLMVLYDELSFDYQSVMTDIKKWFQLTLAKPEELKFYNTNRLIALINSLLYDNDHHHISVREHNDSDFIKVILSGNSKPIEFRVYKLSNAFKLHHVRNNEDFTVNFFNLSYDKDKESKLFCDWFVNFCTNVATYEHCGYTIKGFTQDHSGNWKMWFVFDNETEPYEHFIPLNLFLSELVNNMLILLRSTTDYDEALIDRDNEYGLPMLSYNQVLGLKNQLIPDAELSYDDLSTNPILFPEKVVHKVILDFMHPLTRLLIKSF